MSSKTTKTLFLVWQPTRHSEELEHPIPVGRLGFDGQLYRFEYLKGVKTADKFRFAGLIEFPEIQTVYESEKLFPVFANRLMSPKRKDYNEYLHRLGLEPAPNSPAFELKVLGRSAGRKATDRFRVFPYPDLTDAGFRLRFFLEGTPQTEKFQDALGEEAEPLYTTGRNHKDLEVGADTPVNTLSLRSTSGIILGRIPGYYEKELVSLLEQGVDLNWKVLLTNTPPARWAPNVVLIEVSGPWPSDWEPFESDDYARISLINSSNRQLAKS